MLLFLAVQNWKSLYFSDVHVTVCENPFYSSEVCIKYTDLYWRFLKPVVFCIGNQKRLKIVQNFTSKKQSISDCLTHIAQIGGLNYVKCYKIHASWFIVACLKSATFSRFGFYVFTQTAHNLVLGAVNSCLGISSLN
jgi:hypothetical protein